MQSLDMDSVVNRTDQARASLARVSRGRRRILGAALLVSALAATLSGCIVAPGYVAPGPVYYAPYYAPAPVVVAPAPLFGYGRWHGRRW
jgi:hypothetical protein